MAPTGLSSKPMVHRFEQTILLPDSVENVFAFHASINNICRLVPDYLVIKIINAPDQIGLGDKIHIHVSLYKFTFCWDAEIAEYEQNQWFVDTLKKGPFAYWRHQHLFASKGAETLMTDRIEYEVGFGILGEIAYNLFVLREIKRIFTTRHKKALEYFSNKRASMVD